MNTRQLTLATLCTLMAFPSAYAAGDDDIAAYEKEFLTEIEEMPVNSGFISAYAKSKARRALSQHSQSELVISKNEVQSSGGDTAVGGVIIKPGAKANQLKSIYIIGNNLRGLNVLK
jgi:hypothetical protein